MRNADPFGHTPNRLWAIPRQQPNIHAQGFQVLNGLNGVITHIFRQLPTGKPSVVGAQVNLGLLRLNRDGDSGGRTKLRRP